MRAFALWLIIVAIAAPVVFGVGGLCVSVVTGVLFCCVLGLVG